MANNQDIRKQKADKGNCSSCLWGEWFVQPPNQRFIKNINQQLQQNNSCRKYEVITSFHQQFLNKSAVVFDPVLKCGIINFSVPKGKFFR